MTPAQQAFWAAVLQIIPVLSLALILEARATVRRLRPWPSPVRKFYRSVAFAAVLWSFITEMIGLIYLGETIRGGHLQENMPMAMNLAMVNVGLLMFLASAAPLLSIFMADEAAREL